MAFLHCVKRAGYQNPYLQRLRFDLLVRRVRKLQNQSPFAYYSRERESHRGLRIANPLRSKVTKHCLLGISRTTDNGKLALADGLSRKAQCFANIFDLKVRIST